MQLFTSTARERVDALLRDVETTGLGAELRDKVEAKRDIERRRLAAELKQVPVDRDKTMPPLVKALRVVESRFMSLQNQLAAEWRLYCEAATARDSADYSFDKRAYALRRQLGELAPEVLSYTSIKLERMADLLRDKIYFYTIGLPVLGGPGVRLQPSSNLLTIEPILAQIKEARALIEQMVYEPVDYATIQKNCEAILGDVRQKVAATAILTNSQLNEMLGEVAELPPPIGAATASESLAPRAARATAA
jgi:hypothetical protein